jgi:hypothetical protein
VKKRYVVWDSYDGCFKATDAIQRALDYAASEDYMVLDAETGEWLLPDGSRQMPVDLDAAD